jgi:hypothetical protein
MAKALRDFSGEPLLFVSNSKIVYLYGHIDDLH